ncbi:unnamed protein product [Nippostrongylus brasiliensis]|uniref:Uncharacterized protein n=1 Tax=Nippostrongylus brasiliensis TaxID=27835 RepID=A0A0N4XY07_NIPBR|nr:unnamed protein product [Nippostrongylus brasiliensis]
MKKMMEGDQKMKKHSLNDFLVALDHHLTLPHAVLVRANDQIMASHDTWERRNDDNYTGHRTQQTRFIYTPLDEHTFGNRPLRNEAMNDDVIFARSPDSSSYTNNYRY